MFTYTDWWSGWKEQKTGRGWSEVVVVGGDGNSTTIPQTSITPRTPGHWKHWLPCTETIKSAGSALTGGTDQLGDDLAHRMASRPTRQGESGGAFGDSYSVWSLLGCVHDLSVRLTKRSMQRGGPAMRCGTDLYGEVWTDRKSSRRSEVRHEGLVMLWEWLPWEH